MNKPPNVHNFGVVSSRFWALKKGPSGPQIHWYDSKTQLASAISSFSFSSPELYVHPSPGLG